ncbi:Uncharacterised protein [uncultured archaeon]|nr:Uncharacterised protein [uncultured archaeon]
MKNKLAMAVSIAAIIAVAVIMPNAMATGNGAPKGAHYNLNLIGKEKNSILPNDANDGHRIFVNLYGRSNIYLQNGTDFGVIDADATDGRGAFQMPAPNNQYDISGNYSGPGNYTVWIRAVGKPGGNGNITTCAIDPLTLEEVCSTDNVILMRTKGQQKFTDVTKELTTITYYNATLGKDVTVDIFDPSFSGYLWDYDNNGLKTVQLRFYPNN